MSVRDSTVEFEWADGRHRFRLAIAQLEELQEKCNAGPMVIRERLNNGTFLIADIRETLRLGLIGGGMDPDKARRLVDRYAGDGQLGVSRLAAFVVVAAAVIAPEDEPGKSESAKDGETAILSPMAA